MSQLDCIACGYIPVGTVTGYETSYINEKTDIYGRSGNYLYMGVIRFGTSIKDVLELTDNNITWNNLQFDSVILTLYNSTAANFSAVSSFSVGITDELLPEKQYNNANPPGIPTRIIQQSGFTNPNLQHGASNQWDLTNLFNSFKNTDNYSFQPDTATWYLYIWSNSLNSGDRFGRKSQNTHFLTINGRGAGHTIKYYTNNAWQNVSMSYYDSSSNSWVPVNPQIYNNNSWN